MQGIEYWKSLSELAESPEILEKVSLEFPGYNPDEVVSFSRRRFMKLMSASMALAGLTLTGCRRWPKETLAPHSSSPRDRAAGVAEQYATVLDLGGVAQGLLVTSYEGRPIKIEGNPLHPAAQTYGGKVGSASAYAQASVLELYDPDRSRSPINRSGTEAVGATWDQFYAAIAPLLSTNGQGLAILSEYSSSPTVQRLREQLLKALPQAGWYEYEPISRENEIAGSVASFGKPVRSVLHLDKADVIVSLDADILGSHPAQLRYANDWAKRRRSADEHAGMSRMYLAESSRSITGAAADVRLGVRPSRIGLLAAAIAARIAGATDSAGLEAQEAAFVQQAAADLKHNGVLVAGSHVPAEVHSLVHTVNAAIGAVGKTVTLHDEPAPAKSLLELATQIKGKGVTTLIILGGNPAYDAPADLGFADLLASVPLSAHLSLYDNETSQKCKWHLPKAHYLESWGDARSWDGTLGIQQPLILPLFGGRSTIELVAMLLGEKTPDGRALVVATHSAGETEFRRALHDGLFANSAYAPATAQPKQTPSPAAPGDASGLELRFVSDQSVYDGRFANSGWLQELPDSLSKLTWDNAALISKADADKLGVGNGDVLRLTVGQRSLDIPAFIVPGQPVGVISLPLGYGRTAAGNVGSGVGFNTYALRGSDCMGFATGVQASKTGATYKLVATQEHHLIDSIGFAGREHRVGAKGHSGPVVREATFAEYEKDPHAPHHGQHHGVALQIFESPSAFNTPHAWGMAIDMNACIGCNACVVACQAENNIPVVGKEQVDNNREMHWLRIDRYFKGSADDPNPDVVFQPMMCVHCENAPCEQVCPVAATVHDTEGLNVMVYNRCIGTRYCSNNCPYKVRRFNYFDWHSKDPRAGTASPWLRMPDSQQAWTVDKIKQMVFNPEVSVRMRGVMEKCTYCVQRIHTTQSAKRVAGQEVADGDIVTACQQTCPTEAIVFGNLNDPNSRVSKLHQNPRSYSVLEDLNTKPRTKHMAKLRNRAEGEHA